MPNSPSGNRNQAQVPCGPHPARAQRKRMLLAAGLLLVAIAVVLYKDHGETTPAAAPAAVPQRAGGPETTDSSLTTGNPAPAPPVNRSRKGASTDSARRARTASAVAHNGDIADPSGGPSITASRAVLPPLSVEVVAGDHHRMVKPGNPSMKVEMREQASVADEPQANTELAQNEVGPLQPASESVHMSTDTGLALAHNVPPSYPLLAQKMKVQGSVVLEALIGKDGGIQDLKVVQGPSILADAAREAVRQWRFKPYLQGGAAVETLAHITVNFQISTN